MSRRRGRGGHGPHGLVCVDKPAGPTSFAVLRAVQRRLGAARAGHAGTLDPAASGVLVVLLGEGTKLSPWAMGYDKVYAARVRLGLATDTLDAEGAVVEEAPVPPEAREPARVAAALARFVGVHPQVPPRYSALKRDGRSLMSRARAGEDFEVEAREVACHRLDLLAVEGDELAVRVACGKGFYVRSLARDLGEALGVPAHLAALRREAVGPWTLAEARPPDALTVEDVVPLARALPDVPAVTLSAEDAEAVRHGRRPPADGDAARAVLLDPAGEALAMGERTAEGQWRVVRGFRRSGGSDAGPSRGD